MRQNKKNVTKRYLVLLYYHYILFLDINLDVPNQASLSPFLITNWILDFITNFFYFSNFVFMSENQEKSASFHSEAFKHCFI